MRLSKTLHGLCQSPRVSNKFSVSKLEEYGFDQIQGDPCTFRLRDKRNPWKVKMLSVHVDDIIVGSLDAGCDALIRFLRKSLPTNNLREPTYYTECVFERDWDKGRWKSVRPLLHRPTDRSFRRYHDEFRSPLLVCWKQCKAERGRGVHGMARRSRGGSTLPGKHDSPGHIECGSRDRETSSRPINEALRGCDEDLSVSQGYKGDDSHVPEGW